MGFPVHKFQVVNPTQLGWPGRLKPATGAALGISLSGIVFPKPPGHNAGFRAQKNRKSSGVRFCPPVGGFKLRKAELILIGSGVNLYSCGIIA